jgi:hypothetical protein
LTPKGFSQAEAEAVSGDTQVGYGYTLMSPAVHALLWHGTAESVVDLNPFGFDFSLAQAVLGKQQVGTGIGIGDTTSYKRHALLWRGTAESVVDLHQFLIDLPGTMVESSASAISLDGNIIGLCSDVGGSTYVVMWTPVPEPSSWSIVCCGGVGVAVLARCFRERG